MQGNRQQTVRQVAARSQLSVGATFKTMKKDLDLKKEMCPLASSSVDPDSERPPSGTCQEEPHHAWSTGCSGTHYLWKRGMVLYLGSNIQKGQRGEVVAWTEKTLS